MGREEVEERVALLSLRGVSGVVPSEFGDTAAVAWGVEGVRAEDSSMGASVFNSSGVGDGSGASRGRGVGVSIASPKGSLIGSLAC